MSIARKHSRGLAPLAIALSLACSSHAAFAVEGGFDRSFGVGGQVNVPRKANGFDMVLQADGKILTVAGSSNDGEEIARYNSDGTLDMGFADGGILDTQTPYLETRIAVQSDGKILFLSPDYRQPVLNIMLKRYLANGQADTSFGNDGTRLTPLPGFVFARSLRIQADGKIVAMGYSYGQNTNENNLAIARYESDGRLDDSFGAGGKIITTYDNDLIPDEMVIQHDGKLLVVAGYAQAWDHAKIALVRFRPDGSLDTDFGSGGWQFAPSSRTGGWPEHGVALQADGKILVSAPLSRDSSTVLRFLSDGNPDDSFVPPQLEGGMADIVVQADGRIIVAGRKYDPLPSERTRGIVTRLNPDGSIDPDFQASRIDFGGQYDMVITTVVQPDGRIVLFGGEVIGDTNNSGLARVDAKTYCIADSLNPGRFVGFSDSGWFSTANTGRGGTGFGLVGRGSIQSWNHPSAGQMRRLTASTTSPTSVSRVDAFVFIDGSLDWGFGNVFANGATPARYTVLDARINSPGCVVRPGR